MGVHVPTPRVTHVTELPDDDQAAQWARVLREAAPLGSQYQWLHTYARELGKPLELSVHIDDRAAAFLEPYSEYVDDGEGGYWTLKEDAPPEMALLNTFRFPILAITKTDMQRRAQKAGFSQLLELTWFCHTPLNGRPCGLCDPCRFTIEEGLARRVPLVNRATAYVRLPLKKLRRGLARLRSGQQER